MRTPAGAECAFFYEDLQRGRGMRECRIPRSSRSEPWTPRDCTKCPVPGILLANGSPDLELLLTSRKGLLGIGSGVIVAARCAKHSLAIEDPYVGCPRCAAEQMSGIELAEPDV